MTHITKEELKEDWNRFSCRDEVDDDGILTALDVAFEFFFAKFQDYQNEVEDIVKKATPNHVTREYRDTDKMRDTILQTLKGEEK